MNNKHIKATARRRIIKIDEEKCDGCGECVPNCPESALAIVNGKAKLVNEPNCDGLGACIGHCPRGAITIEEREAAPYDEISVLREVVKQGESALRLHLEHLKERGETEYLNQAIEFLKRANKTETRAQSFSAPAGCPGTMSMSFLHLNREINLNQQKDEPKNNAQQSRLTHWPIQLHLINPNAPHYVKSDLLLSADCAPFAFADFHARFLSGKTLAIACPKLDANQEIYLEKLKTLIDSAEINTITVMIMQVPCCFGLVRLAQNAVSKANRRVPIKRVVVGLQGNILKEEWL